MSTMDADGIREPQEQLTWYTGISGGQAWGKVFTNIL